MSSTMKGMALHFRSLIVASLGLAYSHAFAQADTPPSVKLTIDDKAVSAGKPFHASVTVTFADGLHAYQNPPSADTFIPVVVKVNGKEFTLATVKYPKGSPAKVAGEEKPVNIYTGTIKIPLSVKAPAKPGAFDLNVSVSYQQCNEGSCFPPSTVSASAKVKVSKPVLKKMGKS